ncbi:MAG: hypothetical protein KTR31_14650 [Myxococcales bacterium]|nr:hypothetical protein [Myxococcales bacterium]
MAHARKYIATLHQRGKRAPNGFHGRTELLRQLFGGARGALERIEDGTLFHDLVL